uniref:Odorant-binding protein 27 n=1 Tax=Halyomorpha halys TaxID=286706 RepID=A0A1N7TMV4_HALHY|nr:odorant-binding protein 27 [Halyomorpha halys]
MNAVLCITTLLAAISVSGAMAPEYKKKLLTSLSDCMEKHNVDKEEIMQVIKNEKLPEDKEKQCLFGCLIDNMGYVKDLTLDWNLIKASNPEKFDRPEDVEKANTVTDTCAKTLSEKQPSLCELGVNAIKCIHQESLKIKLPKPEFSFD